MPEADIDHLYDYDPSYIAGILKSVKTIAMLVQVLIKPNSAMVCCAN